MRKQGKPGREAVKRPWYAWALHFQNSDPEVRRLSPKAREGFDAACKLARNASERSEAAPGISVSDPFADPDDWDGDEELTGVYRLLDRGGGFREQLLPQLLTPADLAVEYWETAEDVQASIELARKELFGRDLSRSGIYYRLSQRRARGARTCAEADCARAIPAQAHGRTRYCAQHASGAARVRRHRAATGGAGTP